MKYGLYGMIVIEPQLLILDSNGQDATKNFVV